MDKPELLSTIEFPRLLFAAKSHPSPNQPSIEWFSHGKGNWIRHRSLPTCK